MEAGVISTSSLKNGKISLRFGEWEVRHFQPQRRTDAWMANGVRLAWLLDPESQTAWVYRTNGNIEAVAGFDKKLSGEDVLPGFEFDLSVLKG